MNALTAFFIYILLWWITLFTVLPIGVRRHGEQGRGHDAGAPLVPDLKKKLILNTLLSAAVLAVIYALTELDVIRWHQWFDDGGWK